MKSPKKSALLRKSKLSRKCPAVGLFFSQCRVRSAHQFEDMDVQELHIAF